MTSKWLYLPLEILNRELDAKLLLTYYAVKNNYHVIIGKRYKMWNYLQYLPKGIFFSKGYVTKKRRFFEAKEHGHAVVELDEEGLLFNEDFYLSRRMFKDFFLILDQIYCWGNGQRDTLINAYGQPDKIYLTGHPRFDLVKEKFRTIYQEEADRIKNKYGDFILVNTRFGKYNGKDGFDHGNHSMKKLYEQFIFMIKKLSAAYPNVTIIVRPHPGESFASYRHELYDCDNAIVVHEGNVLKWILAAKLVIHNGCTTGIESFLLDKPVVAYIPFESEDIDEYLPNAVSVQARTIDDIINVYNGNISENDRQLSIQTRKEILDSYYAAMDEKYAYNTILHLLDQLAIKGDPSSFYSYLQHHIVQSKRSTNRGVSENKIRDIFSKLDVIEGSENKLEIRKLEDHLFLITPKND